MKKRDSNPFIELVPSDGGRPQKILTKKGLDLVFKLSKLMATDEEIADALSDENEKISVDTLTNENNLATFTEYKRKGQSGGKVALRTMQFASAKKGSVPMQIFLGKNYLGQTDKQDVDMNGATTDTTVNIVFEPVTPEDIESMADDD